MGWKWVILWSLWAARLARQPTQELRIRTGLLRGYISPDGTYAEYLGIPYAAYDKTFQDSHPVTPWEGVLDAKDENIRCRQRFSKDHISGRDDCLTLNVYTPLPKADDSTLKPVMFFIHGGGFRDGSGGPAIYGPEYLVKHDVILVTSNYRLEVLGFLCLGIEGATGNMGLKDQVQALKWVNENIKTFGGDPDNVSIFGESAGAAAVGFHLLSPMSRGLFHRAILQSGSALSPWAFQMDPLGTASRLAKALGYDTKDPHELYKIFSNKTPLEMISTRVPRNKGDVVLSENIFVPCAEKKIPGVEAFITEIPYDLLSTGRYTKVPIIIGHNNVEGYMFMGKENDTTISNFNFYDALPRDLQFPTTQAATDTAEKLRKLYMGDKQLSNKTIDEIARFEGDAGITYSVISTIDIMLKNNAKPIHAYKFSYDGWMNVISILYCRSFKGVSGAAHADELFYMFNLRIRFLNHFLETDMINKVSTLWTNFAKYGEPTPHQSPLLPNWKPLDPEDPRVLVIDKQFSTSPLWDDHIIKYWSKVYSKYRRKV
ncbi:hypothetical protein O0L34_g3696 [Tuta absoluta]|nr:hypothetical protein O0L34_g3696 [Tuta absoluta]